MDWTTGPILGLLGSLVLVYFVWAMLHSGAKD